MRLFVLLGIFVVVFSPFAASQEVTWREQMDAGVVSMEQSRYADAIFEFSIALDIAQKYFPTSEPFGLSHFYLARAYRGQGNTSLAEKHFELALENVEKLRGENHPLVSQVLSHLGNVYRESGNYHKALEAQERAVKIYKLAWSESVNKYGPEMRGLAISYNNLALVYSKLERYQESIETYEMALPMFEVLFGSNDVRVTEIFNNIGQNELSLGNFLRAEIAHTECLKRRQKEYGLLHADVGWSHNNLAWVQIQAGKYEEAETHLNLALDTWDAIPETEYRNKGSALSNLCVLRKRQGRDEEAVKLCKKSLSILVEGYGPDHEWVKNTQINLEAAMGQIR